MEVKSSLVLAALFCGLIFGPPSINSLELQCTGNVVEFKNIVPQQLKMESHCVEKMIEQIKRELNAALTYLSMGAHFSRDSINLPGFAKFFFESASEEREHAIKLIEYLLMRNELANITLSADTVIPGTTLRSSPLESGLQALNEALALEVDVTKHINNIISECESGTSRPNPSIPYQNDYHLVDYLSGDFLTEQYKGQRDLAGKVMTLGKMMDSHGSLGEFLFDKKLLMGEV